MPYEFLNIGGKKMSTSKGTGAAAHEIADLLPPELLRFLFLRHKPNKAIEFDPRATPSRACSTSSTASPRRSPASPSRGELPPDPERHLRASLVDASADLAVEAARVPAGIPHLALLLQVPGVDIDGAHGGREGRAAGRRRAAILARAGRAARDWLEDFAPDRYRVAVAYDALPAGRRPS